MTILKGEESKEKGDNGKKKKPQFLTVNLNTEVMAYYFPGVSDLANGISHSISIFVKFLPWVRD